MASLVGWAADGLTAARMIDDFNLVWFSRRTVAGDLRSPSLKAHRHRPEIIFTTAYDDYAVPAFELEALDYLLKPFGRERFRRAVERVRRR